MFDCVKSNYTVLSDQSQNLLSSVPPSLSILPSKESEIRTYHKHHVQTSCIIKPVSLLAMKRNPNQKTISVPSNLPRHPLEHCPDTLNQTLTQIVDPTEQKTPPSSSSTSKF